MHTLFMIELSVRRIMPISGSLLALFLMQHKIFIQNKTQYVQFNVAVNKGFGEQEHANFFQCVLFGKAAERIINAGVRKGSLLFITGDLDLVEFTRRSDGSKGMIPKITVYEWSYVPGGKRAEGGNANAGSGAPSGADDGFMTVEDCGENGLPFN